MRRHRSLLTDRSAEVFPLVSRNWLQAATSGHSGSSSLGTPSLEWVLDLHHWFEIYRPSVAI